MIKTKIPIGEYTLNSDKLNWWITKTRYVAEGKHKGEPYEENVTGYCWTLDKAIQTFTEREIGSADANTIEELLAALQGVCKAVSDINETALEQNLKKIEGDK